MAHVPNCRMPSELDPSPLTYEEASHSDVDFTPPVGGTEGVPVLRSGS